MKEQRQKWNDRIVKWLLTAPRDFYWDLDHVLSFCEWQENQKDTTADPVGQARPHGLVNALEREIIQLNEELRLWRLEFRLWHGAWLRHLGGYIVRKTHEIDGFGLRHEQQLCEKENAGLKAAAALVHKFTNPLVLAEKLQWLESPMTFARMMQVIEKEILALEKT